MAIAQDTTGVHFPINRHFTTENIHPYDEVSWEFREALITNKDGEIVFQQKDVEFPSFWSQTATNVVASKYFRGQLNSPQRETSVKDMIGRIVSTLTTWGSLDEYFQSELEADTFNKELTYILLHQYAAFNSPVYFNIGCPDRPQICSACYILSVEDSMPGILEWYRQEGMIFTGGSGSGINISSLRADGEPISKGGKSSGPLSFMRAADASAFSIKSGGTTRRSARMVIMDVDHPDILKFIWAKAKEEEKARALKAAGYDDSVDGEIYATIAHQNCNMSVRVSDKFMTNEIWLTKNRTNDEVQSHKAIDIFRAIAEATHNCGDPGMNFADTIDSWHTCPNSGSIKATNPCSEFIFLDNHACNLSSINLLKFLKEDGSFDIEGYKHTVDVMITAMEIMVSRCEYPTPEITQNSHDFRTLGLGYANLGALLMAKGFPYDSDEGRDYAASITALMTGEAYKRSAELAAIKGPFSKFELNRERMLKIIAKHLNSIPIEEVQYKPFTEPDIWVAANNSWCEAENLGWRYGYRNAQVSLLAPTGTISIMMDCDTTGVEPDSSLVHYKKLAGGGTIKHVNGLVTRALKSLGYLEKTPSAFGLSIEHIKQSMNEGKITGLAPMHFPVFDCAFPDSLGRSISWEGHVKMVAAVQPFLSGGVSKTINMPQESTVEDIEKAYRMAWELGCKTIAIYRDGSKQTQVLTTTNTEKKDSVLSVVANGISTEFKMATIPPSQPVRRRLPDERPSITHKFSINSCEGYLTCGLFDDGSPGELFIRMAKEGSTLSGFADAFATMVSLALQYNIPLNSMIEKFRHTRFEPAGFTYNKDIPMASSIVDYIFHWLDSKFSDIKIDTTFGELPRMTHEQILSSGNSAVLGQEIISIHENTDDLRSEDACSECGSLLRRNGSCTYCPNCGTTTGCS